MGGLLSVLFVPWSPPIEAGDSVLITGCDTGFGHLLAQQLVHRGYRVFAGCLTPSGVKQLEEKLANSPLLDAFILDITSASDIDACAERIRTHCPNGLNALVNNAGVSAGYFIEWSKPADFRRTIEVNYLGTVNMTLAHLPLLRRASRARIINVASVAGFTTAPGMGSFTASKHAIEGFSDVLRIELRPFGIPVCIMEPAFQRTNIILNIDRQIEDCFNSSSPEVQEIYGQDYMEQAKMFACKTVDRVAINPQATVSAMIAALTSSHPSHRYRTGFDAKYIYPWITKLPTFITDLLYLLTTYALPLPAALQAPRA